MYFVDGAATDADEVVVIIGLLDDEGNVSVLVICKINVLVQMLQRVIRNKRTKITFIAPADGDKTPFVKDAVGRTVAHPVNKERQVDDRNWHH